MPIIEAETTRVSPRFTIAPARLSITTDPAGAQVQVNGRTLDGVTPKTWDNLAAATGVTLVITKASYTAVTKTIDLKAGELLELTESLKAVEKFGFVKIDVTGVSSADVVHNGKSLGRNEGLGCNGICRLKLPAGRQTLLLINPETKKRKMIVVDVVDGGTIDKVVPFD